MKTRVILTVVAGALLASGVASAEPIVLKPGKHVLPMSGLELDLPRDGRKGFAWSASASWALSNEGRSFDGRDVLDAKVGDKLVGGTWIHVGHFDAGGCDKVVMQAELGNAWASPHEMHGATWSVRGGIFKFDKELGEVPTAVLCAERPNRKALLVYQFFIEDPSMTMAAMLDALGRSKLLANLTASWKADKSGAVATRTRPEVRDRGTVPAVRSVKLEVTSLTISLPDDGSIWLAPAPGEEDVVDWIERMAPSTPEIEVEVLRAPAQSCAEVFDQITADKRSDTPPRNLPKGWEAGPTLVIDGKLERTMCHLAGKDAIVVGAFVTPDKGPKAQDMKPIGPLLDAIAAGAAALR
ncbi:MAG: hypothetical protein IT385_04160 [Deltaproteobacteria bacterium]|nr:hypothetical protein [Deltaproteobacteria bacterium]